MFMLTMGPCLSIVKLTHVIFIHVSCYFKTLHTIGYWESFGFQNEL